MNWEEGKTEDNQKQEKLGLDPSQLLRLKSAGAAPVTLDRPSSSSEPTSKRTTSHRECAQRSFSSTGRNTCGTSCTEMTTLAWELNQYRSGTDSTAGERFIIKLRGCLGPGGHHKQERTCQQIKREPSKGSASGSSSLLCIGQSSSSPATTSAERWRKQLSIRRNHEGRGEVGPACAGVLWCYARQPMPSKIVGLSDAHWAACPVTRKHGLHPPDAGTTSEVRGGDVAINRVTQKKRASSTL